MEKHFPNGFTSWIETFYEVVAHIQITKEIEGSIANERVSQQGTGGIYELAQEWTDEFETKNQGREWDGEFFDEVHDFLNAKG